MKQARSFEYQYRSAVKQARSFEYQYRGTKVSTLIRASTLKQARSFEYQYPSLVKVIQSSQSGAPVERQQRRQTLGRPHSTLTVQHTQSSQRWIHKSVLTPKGPHEPGLGTRAYGESRAFTPIQVSHINTYLSKSTQLSKHSAQPLDRHPPQYSHDCNTQGFPRFESSEALVNLLRLRLCMFETGDSYRTKISRSPLLLSDVPVPMLLVLV